MQNILHNFCCILETPKISVNGSSPTTIKQGDYFACECKGTDGNPPADVTWYRDNTKIVTGKENAILRFPNIDSYDSGTYICKAKSRIEETRKTTDCQVIVHCKRNSIYILMDQVLL